MSDNSSSGWNWGLVSPKYWLTWFAMGLLWVIVQMSSLSFLHLLSKGIACLLIRTNHQRKKIAQRNIELCFPNLSNEQRQQLLHQHLQALMMGVFEIAMAWWWPKFRLNRIIEYEGLQHLDTVTDQGVLLVSAHLTSLEMFVICPLKIPGLCAMYREHSNLAFNFIQRKGRARFTRAALNDGSVSDILERNDLRHFIKLLKQGRMIWYAPDQDMGIERTVFADFMGVKAATLTAPAKIINKTGGTIMPIFQTFTNNRYTFILGAPITNYPSGDSVSDALTVNRIIEEQIKLQPERYYWVHRKFKTRPKGESSLYENL